MRTYNSINLQTKVALNNYDLKEYAEYLRKYPDLLDKLLSFWNTFDLEGLKNFIHNLDLSMSYHAPPLSHKRYIENREQIIRIIRDKNNLADQILDRYYLDSDYVRRVYSSSANDYDKVWNSIWTYEDRQRVIQALNLSPGEELLEVGIGTGNNIKTFPQDCNVTGIDFSPELLKICEHKIENLSLANIFLWEMDAHKLTFDDATFNKILCFYILCCVKDPYKVMEEISRVCVPGGTVVVYDVVRSDIPEVALLQYLFRPIARKLGAIYLEFCPPGNITYDSYFDFRTPVLNSRLKTKNITFLDPFRTVILATYENP